MVVGPGHGLGSQLLLNAIGDLRSEAQIVNLVREGVHLRYGHVPVVLEIVHVHVAIAEAAARRKVEVADDLVDSQVALNAAALAPLFIQPLRVVLALALLHALASTEGPGGLCICFAHLVASVAASRLDSAAGGVRAVTRSAVAWVQMRRRFLSRVPTGSNGQRWIYGSVVGPDLQPQGLGINLAATLAQSPQADFVHAVHNAMLLLARDIHHIERKQLAWHAREGDVQVDLHALAWKSAIASVKIPIEQLIGVPTASLVDNQFRMNHHSPVIRPLAPGQEEDNDQGDDSDDAARCCPDARILDCLCEGIKPGES